MSIQDAFALAVECAKDPSLVSARFCLCEAERAKARGDSAAVAMWLQNSMSYSVGVFSVDYDDMRLMLAAVNQLGPQ